MNTKFIKRLNACNTYCSVAIMLLGIYSGIPKLAHAGASYYFNATIKVQCTDGSPNSCPSSVVWEDGPADPPLSGSASYPPIDGNRWVAGGGWPSSSHAESATWVSDRPNRSVLSNVEGLGYAVDEPGSFAWSEAKSKGVITLINTYPYGPIIVPISFDVDWFISTSATTDFFAESYVHVDLLMTGERCLKVPECDAWDTYYKPTSLLKLAGIRTGGHVTSPDPKENNYDEEPGGITTQIFIHLGPSGSPNSMATLNIDPSGNAAVSEPSTFSLMSIAFIPMYFRRIRRSRSQSRRYSVPNQAS